MVDMSAVKVKGVGGDASWPPQVTPMAYAWSSHPWPLFGSCPVPVKPVACALWAQTVTALPTTAGGRRAGQPELVCCDNQRCGPDCIANVTLLYTVIEEKIHSI